MRLMRNLYVFAIGLLGINCIALNAGGVFEAMPMDERAELGASNPQKKSSGASNKKATKRAHRINHFKDLKKLKKIPGIKITPKKAAGQHKQPFKLERPTIQIRRRGSHNRTKRVLAIPKKGRKSRMKKGKKVAQKVASVITPTTFARNDQEAKK